MHLVSAEKREGVLEIITRWFVQQQSTIQCSSSLVELSILGLVYLHTEDSIDLDFQNIGSARQMPKIDIKYKM